MKALYFDGEAGAAGDMILGALIDLGLSADSLSEVLRPVAPVGFTLHAETVSLYGIAARRVGVEVESEPGHRTLSEIEERLDRGHIPAHVRERTVRIFHRLAKAEAEIHSSTPETVHFHEVGATDAIVDILGAVWGMDQLGIDIVFSAPLVLGSGLGRSAHGPIIYPAPAVMEILRGFPVRIAAGLGETTTPTGAAILAELAEFTEQIELTPDAVGYGAGHREMADRPNLLRATVGHTDEHYDTDRVWLATSDIDNTRPEVFDWLADRLYGVGALDVTFTDVAMKKGRRGLRVEALCPTDTKAEVAATILSETGSIGVRWVAVSRTKLRRHIETITTPWGPIRVKVAETPRGRRAVPEYDDCRRAAEASGQPLLNIIETVTGLFADNTAGLEPEHEEE